VYTQFRGVVLDSEEDSISLRRWVPRRFVGQRSVIDDDKQNIHASPQAVILQVCKSDTVLLPSFIINY